MIVDDIVHSCIHEKVAEAALFSLGEDFWLEAQAAARAEALTPGAWAASRIRDFRDGAAPARIDRLNEALVGADTPVLRGVRLILTRAV